MTCIQFDSQERREQYQYAILYYAHTNRDHLTTMILHTTDRHKTYQLSRQCADRVHGRYARAQMDRGGADACAFGRGGAESTTFDQLTTDSGSHSCLLQR